MTVDDEVQDACSLPNYDHMDKRAREATQYTEVSGDNPPTTHSCTRCGKETLSHLYCGECYPKEYDTLLSRGLTEHEAAYKLWDLEVESWYAASGY